LPPARGLAFGHLAVVRRTALGKAAWASWPTPPAWWMPAPMPRWKAATPASRRWAWCGRRCPRTARSATGSRRWRRVTVRLRAESANGVAEAFFEQHLMAPGVGPDRTARRRPGGHAVHPRRPRPASGGAAAERLERRPERAACRVVPPRRLPRPSRSAISACRAGPTTFPTPRWNTSPPAWTGCAAPCIRPRFRRVCGQSRGGELALLLGATFPERVSAVIGYVPVPWCTAARTPRPARRPPRRSTWLLGGVPLPHLWEGNRTHLGPLR